MAPKNRVIIDTDPGVDDILALLLALSAQPDDLEVVMISVTYGNVPLQSCLRNVVALFHVLEKETCWRRASGKPEGFPALKAFKPIVAVGAEHPLEEDELKADHFHGLDGLHGVHAAHPDLTPADTWRSLFDCDGTHATTDPVEPPTFSSHFTPSKVPAHKEMLRILRENPEDTISIITIGPLTNAALAAAEDPETFLRVKELVVMGGAVHVQGNITPVAEFNCHADTLAAARVYALTSPLPASTMPPDPMAKSGLPAYPATLSKRLKLTLFPLDITTTHVLHKGYFTQRVQPLIDRESPLAKWLGTVMSGVFRQIGTMFTGVEPALSLHDPLCVWYMMTHDGPGWAAVEEPEDIRVETSGQWTNGMHVVDRRGRSRPAGRSGKAATRPDDPMEAVEVDEVPGDHFGWLSSRRGNRINRMVSSPGRDTFGGVLLGQLFGSP